MATLGRIAPDLWMQKATGSPVGPEALLAEAEKALQEMAGGVGEGPRLRIRPRARPRRSPSPPPHRIRARSRAPLRDLQHGPRASARVPRLFRAFPGTSSSAASRARRDPRGSGRRVVGEINLGCGRCALCRAGMSRHCPRRTVLGILAPSGAHAEFLTLPESNLREVPAGDLRRGSGLHRAARRRVRDPRPGARLRRDARGGPRHGEARAPRRAGARERRRRGRAARARSSRARRQSFDLVVEATGSPAGMPRALELVRPRGTIVWKSTHHAPARFDAAPLVVNEVTVIGSRCGRFEPALDLLDDPARSTSRK